MYAYTVLWCLMKRLMSFSLDFLGATVLELKIAAVFKLCSFSFNDDFCSFLAGQRGDGYKVRGGYVKKCEIPSTRPVAAEKYNSLRCEEEKKCKTLS